MNRQSLSAVYSRASMRRRYEVWFLHFLLADGSGAWWFRYLLMTPGRAGGGGCPGDPRGQPVQVWATWFPQQERPQSFIQGFSQDGLSLSPAGASPFHLKVHDNRIEEDSCAGRLEVDGHEVSWDLRYHSTFGATVTNVGWIGFSRTPHSDAVFSGRVSLDGRAFEGEPLGYGLQGHNCGFRHRHFWNWTHCLLLDSLRGGISTFEALEYEIPFGLRVRRALLWHRGALYVFRKLEEIQRDREAVRWEFQCSGARGGASLLAVIDGSGPSAHRLPYLTTDCRSTFEVVTNSLARAHLSFSRPGHPMEEMSTDGGAVLEMVGA